MGVLATLTCTQMQAATSQPETAAPPGTAERLQILDQPRIGNMLGVVAGDLMLNPPVELETPVWADAVDPDHWRTLLAVPRRLALDGRATSSGESGR